MSRPLRAALVGAAIVAVVSGCGHASSAAGTTVRIQLTTHAGGGRVTHVFSLACDPAHGSLPFAARVCVDIGRHTQAMLDPLPFRSTCAGGPLMPELTVTTTRAGKTASFTGSPGCGWPGGTPLSVYFAATQRDTHLLRVMEPRLRCEDDATLLAEPTPWASVTACVHGLWTPRSERLIRLADRVRKVALIRPAALFPSDMGARRCKIPAGDPNASAFVRGTCGVYVTKVWSTPRVTFVEDWPRSTGHGFSRHRWQVVFRNGRPALVAETGPVAPQFWE
jgi:hypothetical protein